MFANMANGAHCAQMVGNKPARTNQGGNQTRGGNYENPGGNSTGTMATQMNANTTSGQPDNSELARFMNNGGGPEPHQGSNPGAQSDPGPKEVGFYDQATNHMGGDDGVRAATEHPSPMRMGGTDGSLPNLGQRGGQNTGTSGAQTHAYSSREEYGAASVPGVTGARTSMGGYGAMDSETRNPVGFASSFDDVPPNSGVSREMREADFKGYTGDSGSEGYQGAYQSRAAEMLAGMRDDSYSPDSRTDAAVEEKPRAADKAGEVADALKGKAGGFFSRTKDRLEDFLSVDLNNDGVVGTQKASQGDDAHAGSVQTGSQAFETRERGQMEPQAFETRETGRVKPEAFGARDTGAMEPSAFETRDDDAHESVAANASGAYEAPSHEALAANSDMQAAPDSARDGGYTSKQLDESFKTFYGGNGSYDDEAPPMPGSGMPQAESAQRAETRERELVGV